jgi:hypothetical protein
MLILIDTIQGLVQRLVEGSKQRSQDIVTRRKRHKRDSKLTAEVHSIVSLQLTCRQFGAQNVFPMSRQSFAPVSEVGQLKESTQDQSHRRKISVPFKRFKTSQLSFLIYHLNSSRKYPGLHSFTPFVICICQRKCIKVFPG